MRRGGGVRARHFTSLDRVESLWPTKWAAPLTRYSDDPWMADIVVSNGGGVAVEDLPQRVPTYSLG